VGARIKGSIEIKEVITACRICFVGRKFSGKILVREKKMTELRINFYFWVPVLKKEIPFNL